MKIRAAFIFCVSGMALAQQPAVIRSETKVVLVDVVVTGKKGAYVDDLTAKDFHVFEDRKEQTITSVSRGSKSGDNSARPTDYMVLLMDQAGTDASDQLWGRQEASRFIDANAGPNRLMAVANFDGTLRIVQSFTDNAGRLKDAVSGARSSAISVNNAGAGSNPANVEFGARYRFQAVKELAASLATLPGRKSVVLLTGSLPLSNDEKRDLTAAIEACNRANVAVYPADVRNLSIQGSPSAENGQAAIDARPIQRTAGGGSSAGLRGDPAGAGGAPTPANPIGGSQAGMFPLANGTGGFVIRDAGELPGGLEKIAEEQGEYYILSYTPPDSKDDVCHSLRVKVDRSGTNVRARSSYCTGKAQAGAISSKTGVTDLEKRAAGAQAGSIPGSMELPFFHAGPGVARVSLAMDISPGAIPFEKRSTGVHADLNVVGVASTSDGAIAARFTDTRSLDFADGDARLQKPVHYEKQFKIAPGEYEFSVVFGAGDKLGKLERTLTIEPWQTGQLALSGLTLSGELRGGSGGNAPAGTGLLDDRTALMVNDAELIPSGANVFDKSDKAYCYVEIYTATAPVVSVRMLDGKTGAALWNGKSKVDLPAGQSVIPMGMELPIGALPAGSYQLEVTATDAANQSVKRTAPFEIK